MAKTIVYIDESGTLPDPKDRVIILAAVGTFSVEKLDLLLKQIRKRTRFRKTGSEIKFYTAGEKTKNLFFKALSKEDFILCALVVDKLGRKIPDTPENYAALCSLLLNDVKNFTKIGHLVFDRHFTKQKDIGRFNQIIDKLVDLGVVLEHVDSKLDQRVNVADMVAGSILAKESGREEKYFRAIEHKIISIKRVNWREVKRRFIAKKLA